ncbi:hypothetical protein PHJA_002131400 [Phtheirospermum japonicum]|uniref:Uncharacterized protein n=1 Tax=Phtheirospermum japonicum TaxID=374723 RepID=A0A830CVM0_9LAMI|nr:hypothetical protein PHJA_002131400 [Phtheirospermum japonicum]
MLVSIDDRFPLRLNLILVSQEDGATSHKLVDQTTSEPVDQVAHTENMEKPTLKKRRRDHKESSIHAPYPTINASSSACASMPDDLMSCNNPNKFLPYLQSQILPVDEDLLQGLSDSHKIAPVS